MSASRSRMPDELETTSHNGTLMTSKQIFAAILFFLPFAYGAYRAYKSGILKPMLQGVGIGLCMIAWFAACLWMGTSK